MIEHKLEVFHREQLIEDLYFFALETEEAIRKVDESFLVMLKLLCSKPKEYTDAFKQIYQLNTVH
ncbi:MAG: hypothetical protein DHS20C13_27970 [Thermodesulfobacteriota bacterium]|nr:MAG: hypothetical protein DHS20C13_27970 [Thermodesulfobacteriota bacterium]